MLVFGTRPEAIKMAPLIKSIQQKGNLFEVKICVTGQHREMLDQILDLFEIQPHFDLSIMKNNQDLYDITLNILSGMRTILNNYRPDLVLVHGDTSTCSIVSLAAFYYQIKVGHIEAGLRTGNNYSPFPEEVNRRIASIIAEYHFAPTEISKMNLINENIPEEKIIVTGNTVIDSLNMMLDKIKKNEMLENKILEDLDNAGYKLSKGRKIILVTSHRRENRGIGFSNVFSALKKIAFDNPDVDIVYPVHFNPDVQKQVGEILSGIKNVFLVNPLRYEQFIVLMDNAKFIITDSGGVQEEAPSLGKPVLVTRNTTERPEAVKAGTVKIIGTDPKQIKKVSQLLLDDEKYYNTMSKAINPYGDGQACRRIRRFLVEKII